MMVSYSGYKYVDGMPIIPDDPVLMRNIGINTGNVLSHVYFGSKGELHDTGSDGLIWQSAGPPTFVPPDPHTNTPPGYTGFVVGSVFFISQNNILNALAITTDYLAVAIFSTLGASGHDVFGKSNFSTTGFSLQAATLGRMVNAPGGTSYNTPVNTQLNNAIDFIVAGSSSSLGTTFLRGGISGYTITAIGSGLVANSSSAPFIGTTNGGGGNSAATTIVYEAWVCKQPATLKIVSDLANMITDKLGKTNRLLSI